MTWRRSSYCSDNACVEVDVWRKSTYSADTANCVQVAGSDVGGVLVRDSKDPDGPVLRFTAEEWTAWLAGVKDGEFDLP